MYKFVMTSEYIARFYVALSLTCKLLEFDTAFSPHIEMIGPDILTYVRSVIHGLEQARDIAFWCHAVSCLARR